MATDSFGTFLRTLERLRAAGDEDDQGTVATAESYDKDIGTSAVPQLLSVIAKQGSVSIPDLESMVKLSNDDFERAMRLLETAGLVVVTESDRERKAELSEPLRRALKTR